MRSAVAQGLRPTSFEPFKRDFFGLPPEDVQDWSTQQFEDFWVGIVQIDNTAWMLCEGCARRVDQEFGLQAATDILGLPRAHMRNKPPQAYYFVLSPSSPDDGNVDQYLRSVLRDAGHPMVTQSLVKGIPLLPGDDAFPQATKVVTKQIGMILETLGQSATSMIGIDPVSDGFRMEGCEAVDTEGNRCIIVRAFDDVRTSKASLPSNHDWREIWSNAKLFAEVSDDVKKDIRKSNLFSLATMGLLLLGFVVFGLWVRHVADKPPENTPSPSLEIQPKEVPHQETQLPDFLRTDAGRAS